MRRTTLVTLLAVGLTLGMSSLVGVAAAEPPTTVDTEEADQCTSTVETPTGEEVEVTHQCSVVETETCYKVIYDPMGMPQVVPYPCEVTVKKPTSATTTADPFPLLCYEHVEGPLGQPQLMPFPCALQD